ncbi:ATP-dependent helicase [Pseudomonas sp. TKO26]|uniref:UvrD-helicase domain-containing protein n=1 Tax=unclassified Pseudomonas TaxID=196821 RepID=UPI000D995CAE|nr:MULTISPECIES: UvrD-helicase domain-containing protein [unclassified Pseudomonas]PYY80201.1 ATP-dependent helicase [Pseudomonas sp. TKO30]PYY81506.1 ATP-dependent helicase [Pseudomonas sp. TKO29]PYY83350.1 ATP-dependent helicase [Pseudomonas sp. TKO26]PYY97470.1 ATP-dependent helicase [Pseudomonas sp. TKO14]
MAKNYLTLAVAGARKTQGLVEHCKALPADRKVLLITFAQANQIELRERVRRYAGERPGLEVSGWFSFLIRHFVKPFVPFAFPGKRCKGFNFEGDPGRYASGENRFFDSSDSVYGKELARLAHQLIGQSGGALIQRLECLYDEILIDEVQDLSGYDWDILEALFGTRIEIRLVGDVRQAVLSTNPRGQMKKAFAYSKSIAWFKKQQKAGRLEINYSSVTWRCCQTIATFSDTIFEASWEFPETTSQNHAITPHDGVFLVKKTHVRQYVETFQPKCLRNSIRSGKEFDLDYMNFGVSKGQTFNRVLIYPTDPIGKFISKGEYLLPLSAADFYVAVTRAEQSVAIVLDKPGASQIPYWHPPGAATPPD